MPHEVGHIEEEFTEPDWLSYLGDPDLWQGQFEKIYNLPTIGRSRYQNWLANQWEIPASRYALQQAGAITDPQGEIQGQDANLSFEKYLRNERRAAQGSTDPVPGDVTPPSGLGISRMGPKYFDAMTHMWDPELRWEADAPPGARRPRPGEPQRALQEFLPDYVPQVATYAGLRSQTPGWLARERARQALDPAVRRQFDISREAIEGGGFLDFLRRRFNIPRTSGWRVGPKGGDYSFDNGEVRT